MSELIISVDNKPHFRPFPVPRSFVGTASFAVSTNVAARLKVPHQLNFGITDPTSHRIQLLGPGCGESGSKVRCQTVEPGC